MKHCNLRTAWSVVWGIWIVLLCVLWVRSYWFTNAVYVPLNKNKLFVTVAHKGYVLVSKRPDGHDQRYGLYSWSPAVNDPVRENLPNFIFHPSLAGAQVLKLPFWFLAAMSSSIAAIPWLRWRFSLRTLLIATTLVALLLGLSVWLR